MPPTMDPTGYTKPAQKKSGPSTNDKIGAATDTAGQNATADRNQFMDFLTGGQGSLDHYVQSAMASAMPAFSAQLQGMRESGVARGMSTGDLQTANEGSLASAFQRNIASGAGMQAMNLYGSQLGASERMTEHDTNNYMDMLTGQRDYETAEANRKRKRSGGILGGLGAIAGLALGGPTGAAIGGGLGSAIGS